MEKFFILISLIFLIGCSTTSLKDKTIEKYADSGVLQEKVIIKVGKTSNFFKDTKFDSLTAKAGDVGVEGKVYSATVNGDAIEKTGGAVGVAGGEVVNTVLAAHGIPSTK